jgi:hypothetical protein
VITGCSDLQRRLPFGGGKASFAPMAGCFGLAEDHHENSTPPERLTSSHACLDVFRLRKEGLLTLGSSAVVHLTNNATSAPVPCLLVVHRAGNLEINREIVRFAAHRCLHAEVWICPVCSKDCYRIYDVGGWRCRWCARLKYPSQSRNRSIPNYARLVYLRRRLGASEIPFSPLPQAFPWQRKRWRLVTEVRRIEKALCGPRERH